MAITPEANWEKYCLPGWWVGSGIFIPRGFPIDLPSLKRSLKKEDSRYSSSDQGGVESAFDSLPNNKKVLVQSMYFGISFNPKASSNSFFLFRE